MSNFEGKKIILILSGSIACFKAASLISLLVKAGAKVKTVTTPSALQFLGEATLEGLTGERNHSDLFATGQMMDHIHLSRWADMMIVYPGSANLMAQWALGLATDLPSTLFLARPPHLPVFFAPAMNREMWSNAIVNTHAENLKRQGVRFLGPAKGLQACGEEGLGRLLEPELAYAELLQSSKTRGRILITYGGTIEKIDAVRAITNFSTGRTGQTLAEQFVASGWQVTALKALSAPLASGVAGSFDFVSYHDLKNLLQKQLRENQFEAVVHLAAVSDYSVHQVRNSQSQIQATHSKISGEDRLTVELVKNPKLLNQLKSWSSNPDLLVVGFKLTVGLSAADARDKVQSLFVEGGVDWVVQNDLHKMGDGKHAFEIHNQFRFLASGNSTQSLAEELQNLLVSVGVSLDLTRADENASSGQSILREKEPSL